MKLIIAKIVRKVTITAGIAGAVGIGTSAIYYAWVLNNPIMWLNVAIILGVPAFIWADITVDKHKKAAARDEFRKGLLEYDPLDRP